MLGISHSRDAGLLKKDGQKTMESVLVSGWPRAAAWVPYLQIWVLRRGSQRKLTPASLPLVFLFRLVSFRVPPRVKTALGLFLDRIGVYHFATASKIGFTVVRTDTSVNNLPVKDQHGHIYTQTPSGLYPTV